MNINKILRYGSLYLSCFATCYALQRQAKPLPEHATQQRIAYSDTEAGHLKAWDWPRITLASQLQDQKIRPFPGHAYLGAFTNHYSDTEHLECFDAITRRPAGHADISLRFMSIGGIVEGGYPFPLAEAERLQERGGALYLVLEPGNNRGRFDRDFSPENITRGLYDEQLEEFAARARNFGGPIFISFRPQVNSEVSPQDIKAAYIHLHDILTAGGAINVTWVWHVNLEDPNAAANYPGNQYVDWIATSLFNTESETTEQTMERFDSNIARLKALGRPVMVEFGSTADTAGKRAFFQAALPRFQHEGVNAAVVYDIILSTNSRQQGWALLSPADQDAFRAAMAQTGNYFGGNIFTGDGETPDESTPPERLDCSRVDGHYFNFAIAQRITQIQQELDNIDTWVSHERDFNLSRIRAAQLYMELARIEPSHKEQHLSSAILVMDSVSADEHFQYHTSAQYIRDYFDAQFQIADMLLQNGDVHRATTRYENILTDLLDENILLSQQIHGYSIPGFRSRAQLELAYIHLSQNHIDRARPLFDSVRNWSREEATASLGTLLYRGETRNDLLFLQARAALGMARIAMVEGRYNEVSPLSSEVMNMGASGSESGFMDMGLAALIYDMQSCASQFPNEPQAARALFDRTLPWTQINAYDDLKISLRVEDYDLTNPACHRWDILLRGLASLTEGQLADRGLRQIIQDLRLYSE
ncbi:MAG: hypothetical protein WCT39_01565 [Candidatus Margulisiibacteriota bacterium]